MSPRWKGGSLAYLPKRRYVRGEGPGGTKTGIEAGQRNEVSQKRETQECGSHSGCRIQVHHQDETGLLNGNRMKDRLTVTEEADRLGLALGQFAAHLAIVRKIFNVVKSELIDHITRP